MLADRRCGVITTTHLPPIVWHRIWTCDVRNIEARCGVCRRWFRVEAIHARPVCGECRDQVARARKPIGGAA